MRRVAWAVVLVAFASAARALDGNWLATNPDPAAGSASGSVAIGPGGALYVGYTAGGNLSKLAHWTGTGWSTETLSANNLAVPQVAVDPADQPRALVSVSGELRYGEYVGGVWNFTTISTMTAGTYRLALDEMGEPHIVDSGNTGRGRYYARTSTGGWTVTHVSTHTIYEFCDVAAGGGEVYVACVAGVNGSVFSTPLSIYKKNAGSFSRIGIFGPGLLPSLALDDAGRLHVTFSSSTFFAGYLELDPGPPAAVLSSRTFGGLGQVFATKVKTGPFGPVLAVGANSGGFIIASDVGFSTDAWNQTGNGGVHLALDPDGRPYVVSNTGAGFRLSAKVSAFPALAALARQKDSLLWGINDGPASSVTGFRFRRSSDDAALSPLLAAGTADWTQTGLTPNAAQTVYLETFYPGFVRRSSDTTIFTAAAPPRSLSLTRNAGGGLTALWSANGNPAGTHYILDLLSVDSSSQTQSVFNTNGAFAFTRDAPTAFVLRARTGDGHDTYYSTPIASQLAGSAWQTAFGFPGGARLDAAMAGVGEDTILGAGPVEDFPAGGFVGAVLDPTPAGFEVETGEGLPPGASLVLTYGYPPGAFDAYPPSTLLLARYDQARGLWTPLPSQHNAAQRRIQAAANGVGTFRVMARLTTPTGLGDAVVYPNPFRPSQGLTLRDLPPGSEIKVLTLGGRVIREMRGNDQGLMQWDGKDGAGEAVKSGVFLIRVKSRGTEREFKVVAEN